MAEIRKTFTPEAKLHDYPFGLMEPVLKKVLDAHPDDGHIRFCVGQVAEWRRRFNQAKTAEQRAELWDDVRYEYDKVHRAIETAPERAAAKKA